MENGRVGRRRGLAAPLTLPAGFAALLTVGAAAAASHGALSAGWVLILAAIIVAVGSAVADPAVALVLAAIGWLTVVGFSRAPYARLELAGRTAAQAAIVLVACTVAGILVGVEVRRAASSYTLWIVNVTGDRPSAESTSASRRVTRPWRRFGELTSGLGQRRVLAALALMVVGLPLLTLVLSAHGLHLDLGDDLLVYLVAVVAVAVIGGFWPAVLAAIAASLLVNWFFTPPLHTLTIADGKSLL
ncbi:MAG TPA: DUF4118 domain-containing protein, partial [Streptosporangiaceae bacterium]|nr:DUF4118 domain-containing protein [Streptosporangiaceae bacterium]